MYKPKLVFWELTERCNLECIHCRASVSKEPSPYELNKEEVKKVIEELKEFGRPILVLTGGEPLYREDIFEIIEYAVKEEFPVALATNGTIIDEGKAEKIVKSGIRRVSISFDGATAENHDSFRGIKGSFDCALRGFSYLKKLGMSLQINTTVTRNNINEIENILNFAIEKGADALHVFLLVPVGCGLTIKEEQQIKPDEYEKVLEWFYEKSLTSSIQLKATCAPHYFRIMAQKGKKIEKIHGHGMHSMTKGCLLGTGIVFISNRGDVRPCGYLPVSIGNVKDRKIKEIWDTSQVLNDFRSPEKLAGKCGVCEFKHICMGCRARAYGETGNYMDEEPFCTYNPMKLRKEK